MAGGAAAEVAEEEERAGAVIRLAADVVKQT